METLNHRFRELGNKINRRQIMIKKKILAFLLVLTIISSLLLGVDLVVYADLENTVNLDEIVGGDLPAGVTYGGNVLTIGTGANGTTITLRGTTNENRLVVGDEVEDLILILDDVEIRPSSGSPISLQGSASVTIELAEDTINILDGSGAEDYAGLNVPGLSSLTIRGTGSLEAIGGEYGAGIGGGYRGSGGNISISGGNIEAIGGHSGAGIGGGSERSGGIITISGGHIEAIGGHYGAGIGGGNEGNGGSITITDGHIEAIGGEYGAGIGGGNEGNGGSISISGGHMEVEGGHRGAGIGGGDEKSGGTIVISKGTIKVIGGKYGAGIGGGYRGSGGDISISGGHIEAIGGEYGAGIGGGEKGSGGNISITDGYIEVEGGKYGAGIGGGDEGAGDSISISGGEIRALGGYSGAGIGGGDEGAGGNISISGGYVEAASNDYFVDFHGIMRYTCGAGIGGGAKGEGAIISISPEASVWATSTATEGKPAIEAKDGSSGLIINAKLDRAIPSNIDVHLRIGSHGSPYVLASNYKAFAFSSPVDSEFTAYRDEDFGERLGKIVTDGGDDLIVVQNLADGNFIPTSIEYIAEDLSIDLARGIYHAPGVSFNNSEFTIDEGANNSAIAISGQTEENRIAVYMDRDRVEDVRLILNGVGIKTSAAPALDLGSSTEVTIELVEGTENIFDASQATNAGIYLNYYSDLTIVGEGTLKAYGGKNFAAIGVSNYDNKGNTIIINGGRVIAIGGNNAVGIGSGYGTAGTLKVESGTVIAIGGENGAGLGGGSFGEISIGRVEISEDAMVQAVSTGDRLAVESGEGSSGSLINAVLDEPISTDEAVYIRIGSEGEVLTLPQAYAGFAFNVSSPQELGVYSDEGLSTYLGKIVAVEDGDEAIGALDLNRDYGKATPVKIQTEEGEENSYYTVTIDEPSGGSIVASEASAREGSTINLTITPASGKQLRAGTLKYNDGSRDYQIVGNSFTMPAADIKISGIFEDKPSPPASSGGGGALEPPKAKTEEKLEDKIESRDEGDYEANIRTGENMEKPIPVQVDQDGARAIIDIGQEGISLGDSFIIIPPIPDIDSYTVGIAVSDLSRPDGSESITIESKNGIIALPSNMLTEAKDIRGERAQINIDQGDRSFLSGDLETVIGDRPLISLSLSIDGKGADWNNSKAPVRVSIPYEPTAEELGNPESIVIYRVDQLGNFATIADGYYDAEKGMVSFSGSSFNNYGVGYKKVDFKDVAPTAWYKEAVNYIAAREITAGTGGGNYSPEGKLSRGEFMVLMMKTYEISPDIDIEDNFLDAGDTWYTGYLAAAKRLGISAGIGDNMYGPDMHISRQEMFTLLYNALKHMDRLPQGETGKNLTDFTDATSIAAWAEEAMELMVETGTVSGSGGELSPSRTTSRAEIAQVLYNLLIN